MHKHLGTISDSTLSLSTNFNRMYKKTTSKLHRLYSLRTYFESSTKAKIFKAMILPCIMYDCTVNLNLTQTQRQKLQTIYRLAKKIIGKKQTSIENEIKKHSVMLIHKCVQKEKKNFKDYFKIQSHDPVTQNNNYLLQIPKSKVKICKKWILLHGCNTLLQITNLKHEKLNILMLLGKMFLIYVCK